MKLKRLSSVLLGLIAVFSVSSCDFMNNSQSSNNVSVSSGDNTTIPTTTNTTPDNSTITNTIPSTSTGSDVTTTNTQPTTTTTTTTTTQGGSGQVNPPVTFTVTFVTNGGTTVNPQTVNAGDSISTVSTSKSGYTFGGWYTDQALKNSYNVSSPVTSALTLYAKWNEIVVDNVITDYSAYNEGAYVIFNVKNSTNAANSSVSYSADGVNFKSIDKQLIRYDDTAKKARADILGLKAGSYIIKVNNGESESITNTINVSADDRSGYAHHNRSTGVGAYNNDGTLKTNAVVVYVSDSNKNSVTATINGKTYTGLVNIIKNANSSYPLDIRILDDVKTCQFNKVTYKSSPLTTDLLQEQANSLGGNYKGYKASEIISKEWNSYSDDIANGIEELDGLSSSVSYGGNSHNKTVYTDAFDTAWNMCNVSSKENITIEGVGTDAGIFQWGFSFSSCKSIEVKNLRFHNYTEDAVGIEGGSNFWLHNTTFDIGVNNWDFSDEQDKGDGDGATDFKKATNLTISYCRYNHTHKSNLIGGSNSDQQWNITLHHNYYNQCTSRLPLGRQGNMHFYNNYYYNCSTCQDIRANAFVLSEYNYFENCTNPQKVTVDSSYTGTIIKSFNDKLENCGSSAATVVTDRTKQLDGNCNNGTYNNFDTNKSYFYYDSTNKCSDVTILNTTTEVKNLIPTVAGAGALPNFNIGSFNEIDTNKEKFTVTFETNGGTSITSQQVLDGSTITSVSTTKSGFTFGGWFTDQALKKSFDVTTPITSDLTLYANWEEKTQEPSTGTNILTLNNFSESTLSQNTTIDELTVTIKSGKTVKIEKTNCTIDNTQITRFVSFGGGGSYSEASIQFVLSNNANVTIYYAGANSGRYVALFDSDNNKTTATTATTGTGSSNLISHTFENVEAGSYAVASSNSSIEIYAIVISYN